MSKQLETTWQGYLRVQAKRESMQGILHYHLHPSPEDRVVPPLLGGRSHVQMCRDHLVRLGCEESRLRQRIHNKAAGEKHSTIPDHWWGLHVMDMPEEATHFPLAAPTLVGRDEHCDLLLPLPEVSRQHLVLIPDREHVTMMDLHSSNGTLVNGVRVHHAVLAQNDRLQVGNVVFVTRRNWNMWRRPSSVGKLKA